MGDIRTCKWCGRSYDITKSSSRDIYAFCSKGCEMQYDMQEIKLRKEKAISNSGVGSGSSGTESGCMKYIVIIIIIILMIYNPQIEMFQSFKTKSSFPQNETFI